MTLFGGYFGSRLMSNIREDKGYTYGISAGTMFYPDSGILLISTETDNEYVEPLIREIYHEIDKLHTGTVSEAELSMVRNYMLGEMCRNYESPFSLADAWMFIAYLRTGRCLFHPFAAGRQGGHTRRDQRTGQSLFVQRDIKRGHSW